MVIKIVRLATCGENLKDGYDMDFVEAKKATIGHLLEVYKCAYDFDSENVFEKRQIGSVIETVYLAIYNLIDVPQEEKEKFDFEFGDSVSGFIYCYLDGRTSKEQVVDILVNWLDYYKLELSNFHKKLQICDS